MRHEGAARMGNSNATFTTAVPRTFAFPTFLCSPRMVSLLRIAFILVLIFVLFSTPSHEGRGKKRERERQMNPRDPSLPRSVGLDPRATAGIPPHHFEPDEELRYRPWKRAGFGGEGEKNEGSVKEPNEDRVSPENLIEVERKWHAVLEFHDFQCKGLSTNRELDEIGEKYGVHTGRNVRLLAEKDNERGPLMIRGIVPGVTA